MKRVVCNILPLPSVFHCLLQWSDGIIYIYGVWRRETKAWKALLNLEEVQRPFTLLSLMGQQHSVSFL